LENFLTYNNVEFSPGPRYVERTPYLSVRLHHCLIGALRSLLLLRLNMVIVSVNRM
jgi:hypothetical protein